MSSFKKNKKASKYADCKNSGKESLLKYYGVKTERRESEWLKSPNANINSNLLQKVTLYFTTALFVLKNKGIYHFIRTKIHILKPT